MRTGGRVRRYGWELALIGVAAVWGATFPIVKCAIEPCPEIRIGLGLAGLDRPTTPLMFLAIRFAVAALIVGGVSIGALRAITRGQLAIGAALGMALCAGYAFQTFGLERTTASNAGFM